MTRIWHCFGNSMHTVDLALVRRMLHASESNVLPVNTHALSALNGRDGLIIGFGDVTFDRLRDAVPMESLVLMLNVNHQTTAAAAVDKTLRGCDLSGIDIVKLEVLSDDHKTSNNAALLEAVAVIREKRPDLIIMPLLGANLETAAALVELGCPLLRVMGSPIGSGEGIRDEKAFSAICGLTAPVILDGGVGSVEDYRQALALGADGCLVNSMLFACAATPDEVLRRFVDDASERVREP